MIDKMYTLKEAQEILGVSKPTLYNWQKSGKITFVKLGDHLTRIPESELKRLIKGEEK